MVTFELWFPAVQRVSILGKRHKASFDQQALPVFQPVSGYQKSCPLRAQETKLVDQFVILRPDLLGRLFLYPKTWWTDFSATHEAGLDHSAPRFFISSRVLAEAGITAYARYSSIANISLVLSAVNVYTLISPNCATSSPSPKRGRLDVAEFCRGVFV